MFEQLSIDVHGLVLLQECGGETRSFSLSVGHYLLTGTLLSLGRIYELTERNVDHQHLDFGHVSVRKKHWKGTNL